MKTVMRIIGIILLVAVIMGALCVCGITNGKVLSKAYEIMGYDVKYGESSGLLEDNVLNIKWQLNASKNNKYVSITCCSSFDSAKDMHELASALFDNAINLGKLVIITVNE